MDLDTARRLVERHVALLNEGVRTNNYSAFLATFAENAVMRFEGVSAGPFRGRDAIGAAYGSAPPDDTLELISIAEADDGVLVRFNWSRGGGGFFILDFDDDKLTRLGVSFLSEAESAWTARSPANARTPKPSGPDARTE